MPHVEIKSVAQEKNGEGKHFICLESEDKWKFLNHHQIDDGSFESSVVSF